MRRCLMLARNGLYGAAPNPMVGAVIVHDGHIIGEGWHRHCGGPHAEVNAVDSVSNDNRRLLPEATIYVSLEPCSHYGRTPPCAELLIRCRFKRVVVGCLDPFAKVHGRGIAMLREAGIDVTTGVLERECLHLNRRFITFHTRQRPWITIKWAQSADGYIDRQRTTPDEPPVQFSTPWTQMLVHRLRATHQAIVVGCRTWELDRPSLTTRAFPGPSPRRCLLTHQPPADVPADVLVAGSIDSLLQQLHQANIQSLLVEGGTATLQEFIDRDLWDECYIEKSQQLLGQGVAAPQFTTDTKGRLVHVNFA